MSLPGRAGTRAMEADSAQTRRGVILDGKCFRGDWIEVVGRADERGRSTVGTAAEPPLIRWVSAAEDMGGAIGVREQVFCREQGVSPAEELDGLDDHALHLVALEPDGSRVIGTLRLLFAGGRAKIGRVAVEREWRGRGIASRMLDTALALAAERGCHEARLASQLEATGLYERAGFTIESEPFEEAGIAHVWMGRELRPVPVRP